jgi:Protein of unknown function (DUF2854)
MKFSVANLVVGLTVLFLGIFAVCYFIPEKSDLFTNLSFIGFYFGVFALFAAIPLKINEVKPAPRLNPPPADLEKYIGQQTPIQKQILQDIDKFAYLKKTHMEEPLSRLKLTYRESGMPKLAAFDEKIMDGRYTLVLRFDSPKAPLDKWKEKQDKLNSFFGRDATVTVRGAGENTVDLYLTSKAS